MHHPFTSPYAADIELLTTDPGKVRARAYDLVLNGMELGGGSIRIHRTDVQSRVFGRLGLTEARRGQPKFGFLLEALTYGTPPHGGIALGLDRLVMVMTGRRLHPRRHRVPQDPAGKRPHDRLARSGRRQSARRAVDPNGHRSGGRQGWRVTAPDWTGVEGM